MILFISRIHPKFYKMPCSCTIYNDNKLPGDSRLTPHSIPGHVCLLMYFINKAPTCHVYLWHFFGWENRSVICIIFRLCAVSYLVSTTGNLLTGILCPAQCTVCIYIDPSHKQGNKNLEHIKVSPYSARTLVIFMILPCY